MTTLNSDRSGALKTDKPDISKPRDLVCKDQPNFRGWVCSQCSWAFNPPDLPTGENFDAIKGNFGSRRDQEFLLHVCARYPRTSKPKPNIA
jgi:hypothetical protein